MQEGKFIGKWADAKIDKPKQNTDELDIDSLISDIQNNEDQVKMMNAFAEIGNVVETMLKIKGVCKKLQMISQDTKQNSSVREIAMSRLTYIKTTLAELKQWASSDNENLINDFHAKLSKLIEVLPNMTEMG